MSLFNEIMRVYIVSKELVYLFVPYLLFFND